jgi:sucrose-6-phosphate hydrolase SacC (GH32 family)
MPGPVIDRAQFNDVLNPSVIVADSERYYNFYSIYDGSTWGTAIASSTDGVRWRKWKFILLPSGWEGSYIAANGSALLVGDQIFYWYEAGDPLRIGLATSKLDGIFFMKKDPKPVLEPGPRGSFDERAVSDPSVIRSGAWFYLFYTALDRARRQRLGVARSRDGRRWEKLRANPILEIGEPGAFDEHAVGEPAVWSSGGSWWMLYTGSDRTEHRKIGLAKSSDGIHWERDRSFPPIAGTEPWDSAVICDPSVEVLADSVRVWFGGGDVPSPDQNLHGQIGMGILRTTAR